MLTNRLTSSNSFVRLFIALAVSIVFLFSTTHADAVDDLTNQLEDLQDAMESASGDELLELNAFVLLTQRQLSIAESFDHLKNRIQNLSGRDPRKDRANELLSEVETTANDFTTLKANAALITSAYRSTAEFDRLERAAEAAISEANQFLLVPFRPGSNVDAQGNSTGGVPTGTIVDDFIPQFIRLLFRFAYLAVFISFIVSGVFFIASIGNEERLTKARQMLYYSLIGFAFITLAFAIVKAITDIDFFNFV